MWATPMRRLHTVPLLRPVVLPVVVARTPPPRPGEIPVPRDDAIALSPFARAVIAHKARRYAGRSEFADMDAEDLEQEFTFRLLKSLSRFDRGKAHPNAFVSTVLARAEAMHFRERMAGKRDPGVLQSLNAPGASEPPDPGREDDRIDLAADLKEVLAELPPDLRDLAGRLTNRSLSEVARDLKIPRSTLQRRVQRLRQCFEDAGLRVYLETMR